MAKLTMLTRTTRKLTLFIYLISCFIGLINCEIQPKLEILPTQAIQRKPVGKSLMLTCRPVVPDPSLVTDLQWRDNSNMTVLPKPNKYYYPLYDSKGNILPTTTGQAPPAMYTETLPGDQSLALLIPSLTEAMQGTYYCSASYANTHQMEINVKIETYVAITWNNAPENQYPILGTDYKVVCEVTASPPPTVDWLRDGDPIKSGGRYVVEPYGLLIKKVQESDDGIYTCRAAVIQTGELVERNIRVEVYIKPEIKQISKQLEAIEGQTFSTNCNASGKPPPEYTWIKELTQQNVATADRFLVNPQTGLLTITRVEQDDYGTYKCIAQNAAGTTFNTTKLNVLVQPKIYEFYNGSSSLQKELAITCRSKGRPAPEITFRRWGSEDEYVTGFQPNDDRITLEQYTDEERGESAGTLRISKLIRTDDGLYQCIARNKGGSAYRTGHITVEFPPDFEHMKELPPVFSWEQRPANLSCLALSIPNATIEWRWNGQPIKKLYDPNIEIHGDGPRSDLIIVPRDRKYYSVYKCIASNIHGINEIDLQLKEAHRPDYVQSAKPRSVTATTMTFDILGPPTEKGLPITAYIVQFKEQYQMDWSTAQKREWSPDSPYIVEGLKPQTSYDFRFAARNMVGFGQFGAVLTQSTPKRSAPEAPKFLHNPIQENEDQPIVISPYSDHFELRWNVPADNGEQIDSYQVKYCPGFKENGEWHEIENECITTDVIETTELEMSHLKANTLHRIEIRSHNIIGYSQPSSLMMKTARDNPYNSASTLFTNMNNGQLWSRYILQLIMMTSLTTIISTVYLDYIISAPINIVSRTTIKKFTNIKSEGHHHRHRHHHHHHFASSTPTTNIICSTINNNSNCSITTTTIKTTITASSSSSKSKKDQNEHFHFYLNKKDNFKICDNYENYYITSKRHNNNDANKITEYSKKNFIQNENENENDEEIFSIFTTYNKNEFLYKL